ncbi:M28 family peptidase [Longimicrobium terrae]|uniref:EF-hand domain-containing protein n=1 Tax=Longimicrobium terrae TaxID=1639882 RepID=A0A841GVS9_9BACT|nr:hypothetical protein [Longimicrobium terrae]MBB6069644.1 hypothetical protein [Longimicrobium terrae]NNC31145.1 M28 family peptidase [Longimicrobium terrae]
MRSNTRVAALACAAAALSAVPAHAQARQEPMKHTARPTTAAITAQDLRTRLYIVADDSMMGRESGTRGNVMGTDYIAAEARRMGLQPAGENGTFFQTVPLVNIAVGTASLSAGGQSFRSGTDFIPLPRYGTFLVFGNRFDAAAGVPVVYGGRIGDPSMITPEQARGKLVVFSVGQAQQGAPPPFAFWAGGRTFERYAGAAGIAIASLDITPEGLRGFFGEPRTEMASAQPEPTQAPAGMVITTALAEQLLGKPLAQAQMGQAGGTATGSFTWTTAAVPFPARNVVAVLPGSDARLRGEYVAVGAHNDHVGMAPKGVDADSVAIFNRLLRREGAESEADSMTAEKAQMLRAALDSVRALRRPRIDSVFNGADDDGSGTVGVLEIAQYMASLRTKPRRSMLFVWHTAEEKGLFGSEYFTDHPTVPRDSIVAQLNIDMIGRGATGDLDNGGPGYLQLVGSRRLSTQMGDLVEEVNRTGNHGFTFDYSMDTTGHEAQIYCRSDHANYARFNIPVTFFTTGGHPDYHMLSDEPQYIDYDKMARVARFIGAAALQVANRDARLTVDKPGPGPDAPCRQ